MSKDKKVGVAMMIGLAGAITSGFMPAGNAGDILAGVSALIAITAFINIK